MDYSDYIASETRLVQLEANDMKDFAAMIYADLRKEMKSCGMSQGGKKQDMINVLGYQFREMRMEHMRRPFRQAKTHLRERPGAMLTREFIRDPSRISFTDLPGEIRNMIYDLTLFESPEGDFEQLRKWEITTDGDCFFLVRSGAYHLAVDLAELRSDRTLSVLHVIGALDKQIRKEIQTFFWAQIHATVTAEYYVGRAYCFIVRRFLEKIGPLGRSALAGLTVHRMYTSLPQAQNQEYQTMITLLLECKNLGTLDMWLPMHIVIGMPDGEAMEKFFLNAQPLVSPGIDALAGALHSIPQLRVMRLYTENRYDLRRYLGHDDFAIFALTGAREWRLAEEVRRRLQARKDVEFKVVGTMDQMESYEEWLSRMASLDESTF